MASQITGKASPSVADIAAIPFEKITEEQTALALADVYPIYQKLGGDEKAAKGSDLAAEIKALPI